MHRSASSGNVDTEAFEERQHLDVAESDQWLESAVSEPHLPLGGSGMGTTTHQPQSGDAQGT